MALPRLIFVTGKGGTGKSTVAAALAIALSRRRATTLGDLDGRHSSARLVDPAFTPDRAAASSPALDLVAITPQGELEAFIQRIVPLRAVSRRMLQSRTFGYVTAALPGLEAFVMLERLRLLAGTAALHDRFVVIDAPATGHALELLAVARSIRQLAPIGRLNRLSSAIEEFLLDPNRFGVLLTVTPEQLALREALEAADALRELGIACVGAILNGVAPALFTAADIAKLAPLQGHLQLAQRRRELSEFALNARRKLEQSGMSVTELPIVYETALGLNEVAALSRQLETDFVEAALPDAASTDPT
jgi:arsenite/tail-anchored protein-transporting ATPase